MNDPKENELQPPTKTDSWPETRTGTWPEVKVLDEHLDDENHVESSSDND